MNKLENSTGIDLFSNITEEIQEHIEDYLSPVPIPISSSLLADTESLAYSLGIKELSSNSTIWHNSVAQSQVSDVTSKTTTSQVGIS